MTSQEIIKKYIDFYTSKGHKLIPNVSLVPENDPTLLFVNSGMFPLVAYLSGQPHPMGKRLVNIQRSVRFEDLDEVGDPQHTIAFHMVGNWSLGDYFKKEQLPWVYEFLIKELGLDIHKMYATVFAGDEYAPKDEESIKILKEVFGSYGIKAEEEKRIFALGRKSNWWKRGDTVGELGGPDSEIYYYLGKGSGEGKNPAENEDEYLEIGNSVFMQYKKTESGWEELTQKNVDFGGGLERIAWVVQGKKDIFETDNFWPIIEKVEQISGKKYRQSNIITKSMRILADHMRTSVFLAMDGVIPSNKDQGYALRRILRRMTRASRVLEVEKNLSKNLVSIVVESFSWMYPRLLEKQKNIEVIFEDEEDKFRKTLERGQKELEKKLTKETYETRELAGIAFDIYQSLGYPSEIFLEDVKDKGIKVEEKEFKVIFEQIFIDHQKHSREGAEQKFKGGLADQSEQVVKYHTTTHLLHKALRDVLGEHVSQKGSNITGERLRFDFSHTKKLSEEELAKVVDEVNETIGKDLPVNFVVLPKEEADKTRALHFFGEKYGDQIKVYFIGDSLENAISKEYCGGPHVHNTSELSSIEIYKQESIGKGLMRIYARFKN
jgi:alanyl-tRNA synthetase